MVYQILSNEDDISQVALVVMSETTEGNSTKAFAEIIHSDPDTAELSFAQWFPMSNATGFRQYRRQHEVRVKTQLVRCLQNSENPGWDNKHWQHLKIHLHELLDGNHP